MNDAQKQILAELSAILVREPVRTERLLLRPFQETDLPDLFTYLSQEEQQRLSGNPKVETLREAQDILHFFTDPSHPPYCFALELPAEKKVVGNVSIRISPFLESDERLRELRGVSLSYVLNEDYWRRGLMSEALRELYAVLFEKGKLDYINSGYFEFNTASGALQKKLGMKPWMEHVVERDGERIPTQEMLLWRADWEAGRQAAKE